MATISTPSTDVADSTSIEVDSIPMQELEEVVVKARRPQAIVTPEKISYNPAETLAGSDGSLYDALQSLPGLTVSGSSISAFGTQGVTITVDGRKLMLQGNALESYIKSLPSANIERIELITAPAARNDASSGGTVLNIRMRRTRDRGFSSGLTGNVRGWKAKQGLGSAFAEMSTSKSSVLGSFSYVEARNPSLLNTQRPYLDGDENIIQLYNRDRKDRNINTSVSVDHSFTDRWSGGASYSGNWFRRRELGIMDTGLSNGNDQNHTTNHTDYHTTNLLTGIYLKDSFEDHAGDLTLGVDYFRHTNNESQDISDTSDTDTDGKMTGRTQGYIMTLDFSRKLNDRWHLSSGMKTTFLMIDNGGKYDDNKSGETPEEADALSSVFKGRENVNAIYIEGRFSPSLPFTITGGARMEQTNVRNRFSGNETGAKSDFSRHKAGVFLNGAISMQLSERDGMMVSYARRVKRPKYSDLNPFVYILDDITHEGGNINLKEAISDNLQLTYVRDHWLRCALSGTYIKNDIARCFRELADNTVYSSPENLPRHINATLSVSAMNVPITKGWDVSATAALVFDNYHFNHGLGINSNSSFTPMLDCRTRLDILSGLMAEASWQWRGKIAYAQAEIAPVGNLYLGVRYSIPGTRVNITLYGRDLLNGNYRRNSIKLDGKVSRLVEREYENMRQIGLSVSWRFSAGKLNHKKRENKVHDEIKRVNL